MLSVAAFPSKRTLTTEQVSPGWLWGETVRE